MGLLGGCVLPDGLFAGRHGDDKAAATLQPALGQACGALADGGALLASPTGELIWMDSSGSETARLALAGAAYTGTGIAVAMRTGDDLIIGEWPANQPSAVTHVHLPGVSARLVDVTADGRYWILTDDRLLGAAEKMGM